MAEAARIHDFTQGFGSFDFAIPPDPEYLYADCGGSDSTSNWEVRVFGVRAEEIPSESSFRFPFFRLPLEIRRQIYKCFTDALVGGGEAHLDAPQLRKGVRFREADRGWDEEPENKRRNYIYQVSVPEPPSQRNADSRRPMADPQRVDILDMYKKLQRGEVAPDEIPSGWFMTERSRRLSDDCPDDEEALSDDMTEYSDDSWTSDNAIMAHPTDNINADDEDPQGIPNIEQLRLHRPRCPMKIGLAPLDSRCCFHNFHPPGKKDAPANCVCSKLILRYDGESDVPCRDEDDCCRTWEDMLAACKNLRFLSQVSPQITLELGQVLWDSSSVEFKGPQFFLDFAAERPAALPLIQGIVLNVDLDGFPALDTQTRQLESMLSCVSEHCNLRSFAVKLWTNHSAMLSPEDGGNSDTHVRDKLAEWAPLFRTLRTSTFDVQHFTQRYYMHGMRDRDVSQMTEAMRGNYTKVIRRSRSEWMPDCMREETAEAAYMRQRVEWLVI